MPPPNVTGVLHMGHILNNTIQDAFIRYARMKIIMPVGFQEWIMHQLQQKIKLLVHYKKGNRENDLSRTEFLKYVWDWKENMEG